MTALLVVLMCVWIVAGVSLTLGVWVAIGTLAEYSKSMGADEPWRDSLRPDSDDD